MNSKQKELVKIFIFLFLLSFILINWNDVSWIFNYREIYGLVDDFFNPYPDTARALVGMNNHTAANTTQINKIIYAYSDKSNSIEIPTINISAPVVIGESADNTILEENLNRGPVYYPGSVLPGENGQIVILGHSAPPNWPHIKYDWVFSDIEKLNSGDKIILYFNNTKYIYIVKTKNIIKAGQDIGNVGLSGTNNILTIISCWPPGKNYQRITVSAELMK